MRLQPAPAWAARAVAEGGRPRRRSEAPSHTRARPPGGACLTRPRATAERVRAAPCARAGRAPRGGGAAWCHLEHTKGAARSCYSARSGSAAMALGESADSRFSDRMQARLAIRVCQEGAWRGDKQSTGAHLCQRHRILKEILYKPHITLQTSPYDHSTSRPMLPARPRWRCPRPPPWPSPCRRRPPARPGWEGGISPGGACRRARAARARCAARPRARAPRRAA